MTLNCHYVPTTGTCITQLAQCYHNHMQHHYDFKICHTNLLDAISTHTAASTVSWKHRAVSGEVRRLHPCWQCHGLRSAWLTACLPSYLALACILELVETHSERNFSLL
jgi:hypothetical protein